MKFQVKFEINSKIYIRNPESSEIGKLMIKKSIDLIYELGFEHFTFKKLALEINSTEATIYRYFENKHRLLLYILNWYWFYMKFLLKIKLENVKDKDERIKQIVSLFTQEVDNNTNQLEYNQKRLNQIVIADSSKVYLVKEVLEINKNEVFKPYKDLCEEIAKEISLYNPKYQYPHSLATTIIETSHFQQYFCRFLPQLTDNSSMKNSDFTYLFIEDFVFKVLG